MKYQGRCSNGVHHRLPFPAALAQCGVQIEDLSHSLGNICAYHRARVHHCRIMTRSSPRYSRALISSIIAVHAGQRVVTGTAANRVVDMLTGNGPTRAYYDNLTAREIEILTLLALGLANKQIAHRIKISDKTVRNHISNIYEKVKVVDRSQAVLYAVRKGLVEL